MVLLFGLLLVIMMIGLNMLFIPMYGITGSALATFISIFVYNTIKLLFVVKKMDLYPFTRNTLKSFGIIIVLFCAFYFWDFPFNPYVNIILKSILITIAYVYLNYVFAISSDINLVLKNVMNRIGKGSK
ncbi:hypothetical protein D3C72_470790 [compost metagenome]